MEKDCMNCKHYLKDLGEYPCTHCNYHEGAEDRWEQEETQDNVILPEECNKEEKDCDYCIHKNELDGGYLCDNCVDYSSYVKEKDNVNSPEHYKAFPKEVIDIVKFILTEEQFKGYCLGNEIKYRLRAGIKDPDKIIEDISKAEKYREWRNGI